jgi:hypothetical protein
MKMLRQKENDDELQPGVSNPPGNGSGSGTAHESEPLDIEPSGSGGPANDEASLPSLARNATGPRTQAGKERSKHNALRHGIFSKVVLLKGESHSVFQWLLNGLREDLQPKGTFEEVLVERIAVLLWRKRRLITAEKAEIQKAVEFIELDEDRRQEDEATEILNFEINQKGALIRRIANPKILQRCLDLLRMLKVRIEKSGFTPKLDQLILAILYGEFGDEHCEKALFGLYRIWARLALVPKENRPQEEFPSPAQCVSEFLTYLREEIRRLARCKKTQESIKSGKIKVERLRGNVPDTPALDRLLRYEASLERSFERTLSQLERLQRMRAGQPVPPELKVRLSG